MLRFRTCLALFGLLAPAAVLAQRDLYVSSEATHSVKRYDGVTGAYKGDFVAVGSGGLGGPQGIAFGPDGNLYVSSRDSGAVIRYNGQTGAFMNVFTTGTTLTFPADISFRDGFLWVADFSTTGGIRRFNAMTGVFVDNFTAPGVVAWADGHDWDPSGNLYVSDFVNNQIKKFSPTGAYLGVFASGSGLLGPLDMRFGPGGDLYVNSFNSGHIKRYDGVTGAFEGNFINLAAATQGQTIGPDGALYVGSYTANFIRRYDVNTGAFLGTFVSPGSGGLAQPNNFVFGPEVVPEPATMAALGLGLLMLRRRRR